MTRQSRSLKSSERRRIEATLIALCVAVGMSDGLTYAVCVACGRHAGLGAPARDGARLEWGHRQPESQGGRFHILNLLPLCRRCNDVMGDSPMAEVLTPRYTISQNWDGKWLPDPGPVTYNYNQPYEWLPPTK